MSSLPKKIDRAKIFLARRDYSIKELTERLNRLYPHEDLSAVLKQLEAEGSLNELRFAESRARHRASLGYGPKHVYQELRMHNICEHVIQQALEPVDWYSAWLKRVRKQPQKSPEAQTHLAWRYGFTQENLLPS